MTNRSFLSREAGLSLVQSFYGSGMKQKDFCKSNGIAYHILQYWKQVNKQVNAVTDEPAKFLPIKVGSNTHSGIKVVVNAGLSVEVLRDSDLGLLKEVIEICRACG